MEIKDFAIASVKHTGTIFLHTTINKALAQRAEERKSNPPDLLAVRTTHFTVMPGDTWQSRSWICPIRDPYSCFVSWYSRGAFGPEYFTEWLNFNKAWEMGLVDFVLPIDIIGREEELIKLSELMDLPLQTDWTPKGSKTRFDPPAIDLSEIYDLPLVKAFGYEPPS